jgi:hypothetical protein
MLLPSTLSESKVKMIKKTKSRKLVIGRVPLPGSGKECESESEDDKMSLYNSSNSHSSDTSSEHSEQ